MVFLQKGRRVTIHFFGSQQKHVWWGRVGGRFTQLSCGGSSHFFRHRRLEEDSSRVSLVPCCARRVREKGVAKCAAAPRKGALVSRSAARQFAPSFRTAISPNYFRRRFLTFCSDWLVGCSFNSNGSVGDITNLLNECLFFSFFLQNRA